MLIDENLIRENALFIDGTKLEEDANKYSFVWRKAVEKYHDKLKNTMPLSSTISLLKRTSLKRLKENKRKKPQDLKK